MTRYAPGCAPSARRVLFAVALTLATSCGARTDLPNASATLAPGEPEPESPSPPASDGVTGAGASSGPTTEDLADPANDETLNVTCGVNTCRQDEICCNERCGVCAFPGECTQRACAGEQR